MKILAIMLFFMAGTAYGASHNGRAMILSSQRPTIITKKDVAPHPPPSTPREMQPRDYIPPNNGDPIWRER